jgi:hypothetical protein
MASRSGNDVEDLIRELVPREPHHTALGSTIKAFRSRHSSDFDYLALARANGAEGAAALRHFLLHRHELHGCESLEEFVLGYVPLAGDLPQADAEALRAYYECISEAFEFTELPRGDYLGSQQAKDFCTNFEALFEKVARLVVARDRRWETIREVKKTT